MAQWRKASTKESIISTLKKKAMLPINFHPDIIKYFSSLVCEIVLLSYYFLLLHLMPNNRICVYYNSDSETAF